MSRGLNKFRGSNKVGERDALLMYLLFLRNLPPSIYGIRPTSPYPFLEENIIFYSPGQ